MLFGFIWCVSFVSAFGCCWLLIGEPLVLLHVLQNMLSGNAVLMGHGGTWWPWFVIGVSCGGHWCHSAGDSFRSYTRYHTVQFGMFLYYRCFVPTELENELGDHSQRDSMGILDVSSDPSCNISNELAARVSYLAGYPPPKPSGDVVLDQADANMAAYFSRDQLQNNWLATLCKTWNDSRKGLTCWNHLEFVPGRCNTMQC